MKKKILSLAVCAFATLMIFTATLPSAQAAQNCSTCESSNLGSIVSLQQNSDLSSYQNQFSNLKCGSNTQDCTANQYKIWAKDCNSNFFTGKGIDINSLLSMLFNSCQQVTPAAKAADSDTNSPDSNSQQATAKTTSPTSNSQQATAKATCPASNSRQATAKATSPVGSTANANGSCPTNTKNNSSSKGNCKIIYESSQNINEFCKLYLSNYFKNIKVSAPTNASPSKNSEQTNYDNASSNDAKQPTNDNTTSSQTNDNSDNDDQNGLTALEQQMVNQVNAERKAVGLDALKVNLELTLMARDKSQDMINNKYFDHNSPIYGSPFDMMKAYGITYRAAGENIAMNSSVSAAHTALMNSPGHRANILSSSYSEIGIGIVQDSNGYYYISQEFIG